MFFRLCLLFCLTAIAVNSHVVKSKPFLTENFINKINSAQSTWKAGPSKFMSLSEKSIKRLMGVRPEYFNQHKLLTLIEHEIPNDLPDNFDAREYWPNCPTLKEIRDDGDCGASWVVAPVETMSDRICTYSNQTQNVHLSAQDVIACCLECGSGCDGGYPDAAWKYYITTGIVTGGNYNSKEGCLPYAYPPRDHHVNTNLSSSQYEKPTSSCTHKCIDGYPIPYEKDKHYGLNVYSVGPNPIKIQTEIYKNGSVQASFSVYADFLTYKSGVYQHISGEFLGGHVVKILGWGVEKSTPYWLAANSWNITWGDKGFFKIFRGKDECGIESDILAGAPKLN